MIRIESVSLTLGGAPVVKDVSLTIPRGGITALVGPNGAGKSSLLSLIARLRPLQTGRIYVEDLEVGQCATEALARKLAILPQSVDVAPRLSVRELVSFGRYPHNRGRATAQDQVLITEALAAFELQDFATRPLDTLSGGQRQRAYLAMTYAQGTDYLLLDEPLNNLDIAASRALMRRLKDLAAKSGRTIVIVLHDINYASAYADHIVAMKEGHLAAQGAPGEIITPAFMRETFGTDVAVHQLDGRPLIAV